jgi:uncharacterized protein YndB with AHSA1/START domain
MGEIGGEAIRQATGRGGNEWLRILTGKFPQGAEHRQIADYLHRHEGLSPWWAQELTVFFERQTGRRKVGETTDGGFQIGVSKTLPLPPEELWRVLTSPAGMEHFIGGETGIEYRITTRREGSHMRMQWKLPGWERPSILQLRVSPASQGRTVLSVHQEKLSSQEQRERMRARWREVLDGFARTAQAHTE